eukprot:TRINITY_DN11761_c1_g1_i2.p2 TRINITY_DN11761_c1_g1~~TRINITY_DN11761_c1_g1_i2.p2  ORF type:complete len:116 (-),score=4.74 TRINITY_DN11761_c1_g1_i2:552-899(-)
MLAHMLYSEEAYSRHKKDIVLPLFDMLHKEYCKEDSSSSTHQQINLKGMLRRIGFDTRRRDLCTFGRLCFQCIEHMLHHMEDTPVKLVVHKIQQGMSQGKYCSARTDQQDTLDSQ